MTQQLYIPGVGINFAELNRREGITPPFMPTEVKLAGRRQADPERQPGITAPLPALLAEQGIELVYRQGRRYWNCFGCSDISPELDDWLRAWDAGQAIPDLTLHFQWPSGHETGRIAITAA